MRFPRAKAEGQSFYHCLSRAALAAKLKYLHLGELLTHWDDYLKLAGQERFSHGRLLTHIVEEQYRVKRERLRRVFFLNLTREPLQHSIHSHFIFHL